MSSFIDYKLNQQIIQKNLLIQYINSLPPLEFYDRISIPDPKQCEDLKNINPKITFSLSPINSTLIGVFSNSSYKMNQIFCNYPGWILTRMEYESLPFVCRTAINLPALNRLNIKDTNQYVIVGDPTTAGSNINCIRGPDSNNITSIKKIFSQINVRIHTDNNFIKPTAFNKGRIFNSTIRMQVTKQINVGDEVVTDYGKDFWDDLDQYCNECFYFKSTHSNDIIFCDRYVISS